jgi:hypothetical protein
LFVSEASAFSDNKFKVGSLGAKLCHFTGSREKSGASNHFMVTFYFVLGDISKFPFLLFRYLFAFWGLKNISFLRKMF